MSFTIDNLRFAILTYFTLCGPIATLIAMPIAMPIATPNAIATPIASPIATPIATPSYDVAITQ